MWTLQSIHGPLQQHKYRLDPPTSQPLSEHALYHLKEHHIRINSILKKSRIHKSFRIYALISSLHHIKCVPSKEFILK